MGMGINFILKVTGSLPVGHLGYVNSGKAPALHGKLLKQVLFPVLSLWLQDKSSWQEQSCGVVND